MLDGSLLIRIFFISLFFFTIPSILLSAPIIIAHRGGALISPENTKAALQKSIKANISYIELDIQLSKDGIPILFHDDTLSRLTEGMIDEPVTRFKLKELKSIDIGSWFSSKYHSERILSLEEAFSIVPPHVGLMIEIKDCAVDHSTFIQAVNTVLKKAKETHEKVVVGSLTPALIKELLKNPPPYPLLGIVDTLHDALEFSMLNINHLAVNVDLFHNPTFISIIENKDYKLWSWVVNNKKDLNILSQYPIEAYITDDYIALNEIVAKSN